MFEKPNFASVFSLRVFLIVFFVDHSPEESSCVNDFASGTAEKAGF